MSQHEKTGEPASAMPSRDRRSEELIPVSALPAPRLQLRWADGDKPGKFVCHYELVIPLDEYDIRRDDENGEPTRSEKVVEIGKTIMTGGSPSRFGQIDAPYRDGAHAKWDAPHLGNPPIFATYNGFATRIHPKAEGR